MRKLLALFASLSCLACSGTTPGGTAGSTGGSSATGAAQTSGGSGSTGSASGSGTSTGRPPGTSSSSAGASTTGGQASSSAGTTTGAAASSSAGSTASGGSSSGSASSSGSGSTGGGATGGVSTSSSSGGSTGGATCTTCPTGYACGTANGIPVCRDTQTQIPLFSHVFVIMMENTSSSAISSSATPYLSGTLGPQWASSSNYNGVTDPSLPNYVALTSGNTQNITCDCNPNGTPACQNPGCSNFGTSGCDCGAMTVTHLGDQLDQASLSWKEYGEGMTTDCNPSGSGPYAPKHIPFLYYDDVLSNSNGSYCTDHVVDFANHWSTDLAAGPPVFSIISPNLNDDMHGTGLFQTAQDIANGDSWLSDEVPAILASPAFTEGGVLFIVWDEGSLSISPNGVPFYLLSPLAKSGGYVSSVAYDHYDLLATIEDGLGLSRLGYAEDGGATVTAGVTAPLQDFFPAN